MRYESSFESSVIKARLRLALNRPAAALNAGLRSRVSIKGRLALNTGSPAQRCENFTHAAERGGRFEKTKEGGVLVIRSAFGARNLGESSQCK